MREIVLDKYSPIISDKLVGDEIYNLIRKELSGNQKVIVDLKLIKSMATFCAKQIFGRLYLELGSEKFFNSITLKNASDDVKAIVRIGIQSALEEK